MGKTGVYAARHGIKQLRAIHEPDVIIANGDAATGGFGIGKNHSITLHKAGVDVITGGDQIYFKKDMVDHISRAPYMLRPANLPPKAPGRGWSVYQAGDMRLGVISMLGLAGYGRVHPSNPYTYAPQLIERLRAESDAVLMDYHAGTTAEKYTMFHHLSGSLAAVIGTGQRVQTADADIFPGGTAVICDAGRTGSQNSVNGLDPEIEIRKFRTAMPLRSQECWELLQVQGVCVTIGTDGRAEAIEAVRHDVEVQSK